VTAAVKVYNGQHMSFLILWTKCERGDKDLFLWAIVFLILLGFSAGFSGLREINK